MDPNNPSPEDLRACRRAAEWAAAVAAANEVGLFDALAGGASTLDQLAHDRELDVRAVTIVIGVLEALGLVRSEPEGKVALTPAGRARYADPGSHSYEAAAARHWRQNIRSWLRLDEILRSGGPEPEPTEDGDPTALGRFMAAMAAKPEKQVRRVVERCLGRRPDAATALDLGGGPGVYARAFAERGLEVVLFDRPETIDYVADAYGLRDLTGLRLAGGDFLKSLPEGRFDVVLLSNITHIYDEDTNVSLLRRLAALQAAGDVLGIVDFVRGVSPFAPLFAVTMLLKTEAGNTYDLKSYRAWLDEAGYGAMEVESLDEERQLITAARV